MATTSELEERIEKCQRLMEADPNSQIFAALAEAYRKKGDLDLAFRICKNGLKVHNNYGSAHVVMAKINLDRGLYDWAEIEAKRATELDGKTRTIGLLLAEIYIYKGDFRQAIKILKELHSKDIDNPQIKKLLEIAQRIPEEQKAQSGAIQVESGRIEVTEVARPGDSPIAIGPVGLDLKGLMEEALAVKGIRGALLVSNEGLVAESRWQLKCDVNECGAVMSEIWKSLSGQTLSDAFGKANNVLIESSDLMFYLVKSHNGVLVFAAGPTMNLGTFRLKIEGLLENLTLTVGGV